MIVTALCGCHQNMAGFTKKWPKTRPGIFYFTNERRFLLQF